MRNIEAAVLAKVHPDFDRERIKPGVYCVDFCVHVVGELMVGESYEIPSTVDLSLYGVLVTCLLESGVKREKVLNVIERVARRAIERGSKFNEELGGQAYELIDGIRKRFAEKLPKKKCQGAIRLEGVEVRKIA